MLLTTIHSVFGEPVANLLYDDEQLESFSLWFHKSFHKSFHLAHIIIETFITFSRFHKQVFSSAYAHWHILKTLFSCIFEAIRIFNQIYTMRLSPIHFYFIKEWPISMHLSNSSGSIQKHYLRLHFFTWSCID